MLIGLTGRAGSGKDTAYETIHALFNDVRPVVRLAFADVLKRSALACFADFDDEWSEVASKIKSSGHIKIEADGEEICSVSGREFFQRYGTEAHRYLFGDDFWIDSMLPPLDPLDFGPFLHSQEIYVITDVRYDNEAIRIREYGGVIWQVERPGEEISENAHASELGIDEELVDYLLLNDGSLDDLKEEISKTIIASLMEKQREDEEIAAVSSNAEKTYAELKKVLEDE